MENSSLDRSSLEWEASCETTPPERLEQLAKISPELARRVARNSFAPAKLLHRLSQSGDLETCKAVAANPNAPTDILLKLGARFPEQLVENPVFMLLMLESPNFITHKMPVRTILNLLKCDKTPMFVFEQVANHCPGLHKNLLDNPRTPVSVFEKLARNQHFLTRCLVARSPRTPVSVLEQLADDSNNGVFVEVVKNPKTPVFVIERLKRCAEASNPKTPISVLKKLASDRDWQVRCAVAKNPKTPVSVLKKLASDRAETVRRVVAKKLRTSAKIREQLNLDKAR